MGEEWHHQRGACGPSKLDEPKQKCPSRLCTVCKIVTAIKIQILLGNQLSGSLSHDHAIAYGICLYSAYGITGCAPLARPRVPQRNTAIDYFKGQFTIHRTAVALYRYTKTMINTERYMEKSCMKKASNK